METHIASMSENLGNYIGYELTRLSCVWHYENPDGSVVELYDFNYDAVHLHMAVQVDSKEARSTRETECAFAPAQQRQPADCQRYGCGNGSRSSGPRTAVDNVGYLHSRV